MRRLISRFSMELRAISFRARKLRRDARGIAVVEFALYMPIILVLLVGEFALGEAIAISRKVSITCHTVVDLITQNAAVTPAQVVTVLNASAQIAAPFSTSKMVIVVGGLSTDKNGNTTVSWSKALPDDSYALISGATFTPPANVAQPNTCLIYGYVYYSYAPPVGSNLFSAIPISHAIYMNPRLTACIPLTN